MECLDDDILRAVALFDDLKLGRGTLTADERNALM